ncbi:MAG: DUF547 domain-containing protein [Geminicoccaceae bacterium]|nr:DUF547 domain-containing protein [Geminicoccaceae bacterium]
MQTTRVIRALVSLICLPVLLGACASIERLAIPEAEIQDRTWLAHSPESTEVVDHAAWQTWLQRYLVSDSDGVARVRYAAVEPADRERLEAYLARLQAVDVGDLDRDEQLAFWVNLYNARTVLLILEHYPMESIRDITFETFAIGPWSEPLLEVRGRPLSLHDVEHRIIRPIWRDARVHYVLNCAAVGCPNLGEDAYRGATIDQAMDAAARAYVNNSRGVALADGELVMSKIYAWYPDDFGGSERAAIDSAHQFAAPDLAKRLEGRTSIDRYRYDWSLNDAAAS